MTSGKVHSANYANTFIAVSPDSNAAPGVVPIKQGIIAEMQYALLVHRPYHYTSDDILFIVHARRNGLDETDELACAAFFSKGQACLRCSPLVKSHGWGLHHDAQGRVALVAQGSTDYEKFGTDKALKQLSGMRNRRMRP